jgi:hypothetical protein
MFFANLKSNRMKKIFYLLVIVPLFFSCSLGTQNADNIAVIESYIEAVENLDYSTMGSLLDDNYQGLGPSYTDSITKKQALENWKFNAENLYDRIQYNRIQNAPVKITNGPNQGDWVSSWAELKITYKNGDQVTIWANTVYRIENGKILKTFTFYNEADAYRQLGYGFVNFNE